MPILRIPLTLKQVKPMLPITLEEIDAVLPQSQCQQCGYPSCLDYANAMLNQNETVDKCLFGGKTITMQLAKILAYPLATCKELEPSAPVVALIDETACIGCLKCVQICPVESIIGAKRQLHTVVSQDCTGCKLCLDACPINCIQLTARTLPVFSPIEARQHYLNKQQRLAKQTDASLTSSRPPVDNRTQQKQSVLEAIARAKLKKAQHSARLARYVEQDSESE